MTKLRKIDQAVAEALATAPSALTISQALNIEGFKALSAGDPERAYRLLRAAIKANPIDRTAQDNLARTLKALGREDEAIAIYRKLIADYPDWPVPRSNLAMSLLRRGEFEEGWRMNRDRLNVVPGLRDILEPMSGLPLSDVPRVVLEDLADKDVLLVSEQGFGDEMFYMRWVPLLRERGAPASVWWWPSEKRGKDTLPPKLKPILARHPEMLRPLEERHVDTLHAMGGIAIPIGDLPVILRMKCAADIPASLKLRFDPTPLPRGGRRRIGITWGAGFKHLQYKGGLYKHIPPRHLGAALRGIDAEIIVIQRGVDFWQIAELEAGLERPVDDVTIGQGITVEHEFDWMAGLLASLDDYVCVSNTNVHILAAMSGPIPAVHVLVSALPEWRWLRGADGGSPWFPGFRVHRGDVHGWDSALKSLRSTLGA